MMHVNAMALITPLGKTFRENLAGILETDMKGMRRRNDLIPGKTISFGEIDPAKLKHLPAPYLDIACNRILVACIEQMAEAIGRLKQKYPPHRIVVIVGSSNTGIHEAQRGIEEFLTTGKYPDWYQYDMLELGSPAKFVADITGITGACYTISTACSSSIKVFSAAQNLIDAGICDAAIVGGVDSISTYASNGFFSLEALSDGPSNPFSKNRTGISIGEAGALFIVSKEKTGNIKIMGVGETSDAHHMTAPRPDGAPAKWAMEEALRQAGLTPADIDYISLHGTGTALNDLMESNAVHDLFGCRTPCSSFKPLIGHTLGACGAVEAALCCLLLDEKLNPSRRLPKHPWDGETDEGLKKLNLAQTRSGKMEYILSNAFAFGGSNASMVIGKDI